MLNATLPLWWHRRPPPYTLMLQAAYGEAASAGEQALLAGKDAELAREEARLASESARLVRRCCSIACVLSTCCRGSCRWLSGLKHHQQPALNMFCPCSTLPPHPKFTFQSHKRAGKLEKQLNRSKKWEKELVRRLEALGVEADTRDEELSVLRAGEWLRNTACGGKWMISRSWAARRRVSEECTLEELTSAPVWLLLQSMSSCGRSMRRSWRPWRRRPRWVGVLKASGSRGCWTLRVAASLLRRASATTDGVPQCSALINAGAGGSQGGWQVATCPSPCMCASPCEPTCPASAPGRSCILPAGSRLGLCSTTSRISFLNQLTYPSGSQAHEASLEAELAEAQHDRHEQAAAFAAKEASLQQQLAEAQQGALSKHTPPWLLVQ